MKYLRANWGSTSTFHVGGYHHLSIGTMLYVTTCLDPGYVYEAAVEYCDANPASGVDLEVEDSKFPAQGGGSQFLCPNGTCGHCAWVRTAPGAKFGWTPVYAIHAKAAPTVPAPPQYNPVAPTTQTAVNAMKAAYVGGFGAIANSVAEAHKKLSQPMVKCTGKHCPDPFNPYASPNQPDGSFKCYSCRTGVTR